MRMVSFKLSNVSIILAVTSFCLGMFVIYESLNVSPLLNMLQDYSITKQVSPEKVPPGTTGGLQQRLPKALIIGFHKCGTSALRSFLTVHPDIVAPADEIRFFLNHYAKGLEWYRRQMPFSTPNQITIEKTPGYIQSYKALQRIHDFDPEVKLLVIVRNPVTRLQSIYAHSMHNVPESERRSFESWLSSKHLKQKVRKHTDYFLDLKDAFTVFPRDQFLILNEDELEENPSSVLQQVQDFLGLRPLITDDMFIFDEKKKFYCVNTSHPLFPSMKGQVNKKSGCMREGKGREHPDISDYLLKRIVEVSKPATGRFFRLIHKKFKWKHFPF